MQQRVLCVCVRARVRAASPPAIGERAEHVPALLVGVLKVVLVALDLAPVAQELHLHRQMGANVTQEVSFGRDDKEDVTQRDVPWDYE